MARYARVFASIWADPDFCALSSSAQRLYLLLITQPDVSHCGVLPLTERRWARLAADTDADSVRAALDELERVGFVARRSGSVAILRVFRRPSTQPGRQKRHGRVDGQTLAARLIASGRPAVECAYCGTDFTFAVPTVDHVRPLARGGTNDLDNLAWACLHCNLRKGTKLVEEWCR